MRRSRRLAVRWIEHPSFGWGRVRRLTVVRPRPRKLRIPWVVHLSSFSRVILPLAATIALAAPEGSGASKTGTCAANYKGPTWRCLIGRGSASGDYAVASAVGRTTRPDVVYVELRTPEKQDDIYVAWATTCTRGYGAGSKSGHFTTGTYRMPHESGYLAVHSVRFPMAHPSSCIVSATAQLSGSGRLVVWLVAFH